MAGAVGPLSRLPVASQRGSSAARSVAAGRRKSAPLSRRIRDALTEPIKSRILRLLYAPLLLLPKLPCGLVSLLPPDPRPLGRQPSGAPRHPFFLIHGPYTVRPYRIARLGSRSCAFGLSRMLNHEAPQGLRTALLGFPCTYPQDCPQKLRTTNLDSRR